MRLLGNPVNTKDLLVFCDRNNKFVKQYICALEKPTKLSSPRNKYFIEIQRAVRNAIETSELL